MKYTMRRVKRRIGDGNYERLFDALRDMEDTHQLDVGVEDVGSANLVAAAVYAFNKKEKRNYSVRRKKRDNGSVLMSIVENDNSTRRGRKMGHKVKKK
jgi:hypothetical protein